MQYSILVVDDDDMNLKSTKYLLEQWGYKAETANSGDEAIKRVRSAPDAFAIILLDYRMPEKNGADTAREIRSFNEESLIVMHSGDDTRSAIKETYKAGAVDFIEKSENVDELKRMIECYCRKYEETTRTLRGNAQKSSAEELIASIGMVGRSQAMADVVMKVLKYRSLEKPFLILGESGTGKELIAKALHTGPADSFFAINCAAYADKPEFLEAELFGYEKNSFTGATSAKAGIFQVAKGGTVFLDELHHLSLSGQAQLLRAVQEMKIRRKGATHEIDVDFRLIAATKPNLEERVKNGSFMEDLYYRVNYLRITVPALRERPEDIEPLIAHYRDHYCKTTKLQKTFLMRTVRMMEKYSWPGNVRDLDACVFKLIIESTKEIIDPSQLDRRFYDETEENSLISYAQLAERHDDEKRKLIISVLKKSKNKAHAAEQMNIKGTTFYSMLERLKIEVPQPSM